VAKLSLNGNTGAASHAASAVVSGRGTTGFFRSSRTDRGAQVLPPIGRRLLGRLDALGDVGQRVVKKIGPPLRGTKRLNSFVTINKRPAEHLSRATRLQNQHDALIKLRDWLPAFDSDVAALYVRDAEIEQQS
jgi:hypothetical protein